MTWSRWAFSDFKTHLVPSELRQPFCLEMRERGATLLVAPEHGFESEVVVPAWFVDRGGPIRMGRPLEDVSWHGLALSVPSEHLEAIAQRVAGMPARRFVCGTEFRKLHCWNQCVVMTPGQADDLLALLVPLIDGANERARAFDAAARRAERAGGWL